MALFRKLSQPILSWSNQFCKDGKFFSTFANSRKVVPLNVIITSNADMYENIKKESLSSAEWQSIRERCLQIPQITPYIVDTTIMDMCLKDNRVDNAIEYFKFLRKNDYSLNPAVIGKYLRLYVLKQNHLSDSDKVEIVKTYNDLREKYPFLDTITAEHCITSLCLTDQWEKSFEILEMIKITNLANTTVNSALASAAFKNKKPDIAWKALSEITLRHLIPQKLAYTSYLMYCEAEGKEAFSENMVKMFEFWAEYNIRPPKQIITSYVDTASKYGWFSKDTVISKTGVCEHCGQSLSKITISESTFQKLVESMMNKVIIGSNIYCKTNPIELENFKRFVEKTKPYDVVIDGLNLIYLERSTQMLFDVVKYFSNRNKKILVLTRKHQKKLPIFQKLQKHALIFYTNNISADDPYILYATIASGKNAIFVSMDLMRQHKHSLKNLNLHREFQMWQCSHQCFVKKNRTHFHVQKPFVYLPTAQKNGDYWHVPYIADDCTVLESHEFPNKWYCLEQRNNK